jgi:hypothetical protein
MSALRHLQVLGVFTKRVSKQVCVVELIVKVEPLRHTEVLKHFGVEQRLEHLDVLAETVSEEKSVDKDVPEFFLVLKVPILGLDNRQAPGECSCIEAVSEKTV